MGGGGGRRKDLKCRWGDSGGGGGGEVEDGRDLGTVIEREARNESGKER